MKKTDSSSRNSKAIGDVIRAREAQMRLQVRRRLGFRFACIIVGGSLGFACAVIGYAVLETNNAISSFEGSGAIVYGYSVVPLCTGLGAYLAFRKSR